MTTMAYNHKDKEIAIDSRYTRGSMIDTDNGCKMVKRNGVAFVFAGESADYDRLISGWFDGEEMKGLRCVAFVIDNGKVYLFGIDEYEAPSKELIECNLADGSGDKWAMAAMDFGKTAKQAVEYAKTRDIYTGGKVRVIKVK